MAREERSAGFLIFHRKPGVAPPGDVRFLLLNSGRHWDFAKGHVEGDETANEAAVRELREETGIREVTPVAGFEQDIVYFFRSGRKGLIRKTVTFFLAEVSKPDVILSEEHVGYEYLPYEQAVKRATFAAAKELLRAAYTHLTADTPATATS